MPLWHNPNPPDTPSAGWSTRTKRPQLDKILILAGQTAPGHGAGARGQERRPAPDGRDHSGQEPCILHNVPCLHDIFSMDKLLADMGMTIDFQ